MRKDYQHYVLRNVKFHINDSLCHLHAFCKLSLHHSAMVILSFCKKICLKVKIYIHFDFLFVKSVTTYNNVVQQNKENMDNGGENSKLISSQVQVKCT